VSHLGDDTSLVQTQTTKQQQESNNKKKKKPTHFGKDALHLSDEIVGIVTHRDTCHARGVVKQLTAGCCVK
jgi:hypothetical protein